MTTNDTGIPERTKEEWLFGKDPNEVWEAIDGFCNQEKKKEAIAFHIWVRESGYIRRNGTYYSLRVKGVVLTDEGLYNLFLIHLNNSK